jgi:hypothetical protein
MRTPSPCRSRWSRRARRRHALLLALLATIPLSACGGGAGEDDDQPTAAPNAAEPPSSTAPSSSSRDDDASASEGTPIRITLGDTALTGRLNDTATAHDLADQLPLTLTFRDHNNVEKTAPLRSELTIDGAPAGHDPAAGDIGYWAPGGDLVLYYDDGAPFFNGIVRIGEFEGDLGALERPSEAVDVTVARAD